LPGSEPTRRALRILGLDPGSLATGYGVIELAGQRITHIAHGCIRTQGIEFPQRLGNIHSGVAEVVAEYQPDELAVEKVFMNRNVEAALKLGQARGAALAAALVRDIPVFEFAATAVKLALVGNGHADKTQVSHMVCQLLGLSSTSSADAADALAVAVCHAHQRGIKARLAAASVMLGRNR
jgi:crossover junction endodeoxyribonuclease RuvC